MSFVENYKTVKYQQILFLLVDTSSTMNGTKIDIANQAIRKLLDSDNFIKAEESDIDLKIACLTFSNSSQWQFPEPVFIKDFTWNDIIPDDGDSDLGSAFFELNKKLSSEKFLRSESGSFYPIIILLSDGQNSSDYKSSLEKLKKARDFNYATKLAFAIGEDADKDVLADFTGDKEKVIPICTTKDLDKLIWISSFYAGYFYKNCTPLMIAVKYGGKELVQLLLEAGANANAESFFSGSYVEGFTPLMEAAKNNYKETAELLIQYGADINAKCSGHHAGQNVLMIAAEHNSKEVAELLIQHGADVNVKTEWCSYSACTALMFAAWYGTTETAELLIKYGADINAARNDGRTALMFAALQNKVESVKLLLEHGADTTITDKNGCTALMIANEKEYAKETAKLLLEYETK